MTPAVTRVRVACAMLLAPALLAAAAGACSESAVTAPSGATLTLSTSAAALAFDGTATLTAQVAGPNGAPVDGVPVTFTTTLGSIQPADAVARGGVATAVFNAGGVSGTATITASASGATTSRPVTIAVGVAAVARVAVSAAPASVPFGGGAAAITALVTDAGGNPIPTIPVTFTTTAGTLSPASVKTDAKGAAQTTLSTSAQAVVTATATPAGADTGAAASVLGTATVTIAPQPRPVVAVGASPNAVANVPVTFTLSVTPAPGSNTAIQNVSMAFGDGSTATLGPVSGTSITAQHVYTAGGTYTATVTATDTGGGTTTVPTVVTVGAAPPLSVSVAGVAVRAGNQSIATLTATVTPPTIVIASYRWDFGDNQPPETTTGPQVQHSYSDIADDKELYRVTVTVTPAGGGAPASGFAFVVMPPRPTK